MKSWCEIHRQFEWLFMVDEWNLVLKFSTVLERLLELGIELICRGVPGYICLWIAPFILPSELFGDLGHINLAMLKQPKLELKRFIRPKTDWFFPNQKVIITILILFLATKLGSQHLMPARALPRSSLKRCNAWKIGLTWLTRTWDEPWQRSLHHFSEYLATKN